MRKLALLVIGLGVLFCCQSTASAAPPPSAATASVRLTQDPFLAAAEVTTSVQMAIKCPCDIHWNCAYRDIGFDCAEPSHCCHCSGTDPALRMCVYNAR